MTRMFTPRFLPWHAWVWVFLCAIGGQAYAQNSPFDIDAPWLGKIDIPPQKYTPKYRTVLGAKVNPTDKALQPAVVTTVKGTEIEKADILIDEGRWNADGTRFAQTKLKIDLGGSLIAGGCLFEECVLSKGGAWFVKWHSSKWTFDHCVFTRRFISPFKLNDIGVKVTNSTFFDVDFAIVQYREDAAQEIRNEWMTVENCRFVRCNVPESFLLMTNGCVFDACTFGVAEKDMPIASPVTVTVNVINPNSSKPKTGPNRIVQVIEADLPSAGASAVRYRRTGKTLDFE